MTSGVGLDPDLSPVLDPADGGTCPFVGLMPFRESDERFFFGRDRERDLIGANLAASRLTILYAPSGVGKSSVLRAGVLPQEGRENQDMFDDLGTPGFITVYARQWSMDVAAEIAQAVGVAVARTPGARPLPTGAVPTLSPHWFGSVIEATGCAGIRLILDQFEEYFLYNPVEPEAGGIGDLLAALVRDDRLPVHVLLSVREESLASLDRFKGRIPDLFANVLRLAPLTTKAARDAVLKPVEAYNSTVDEAARMAVEPELLDELLVEVQQRRIDTVGGAPAAAGSAAPEDAIASPYLQLVLTRLWATERAAGSSVLRRSTLEGLGGAQGIVQRHVDEVMRELSAQDQDLAAEVLHHMVTATGAKVALTVADLAEWTGRPAEVQRLLDTLGAGEQLIVRRVPPPHGVSGADRYEIYHDVLALAVADWRKRHDDGRLTVQMEQEREEAQAQAGAARRRLRRARLVAAGLGVLVLVIGALAALLVGAMRRADVEAQRAEVQAKRVEEQKDLLNAEQELASDPTQSLRSAVHADAEYGDLDTAEAVLKASGAPRYELVTDPSWCSAERPCGADEVLVTADGTRMVVLDTSGDSVWLSVRTVDDPATGEWVRAVDADPADDADLAESLGTSSITAAAVNEDASLVAVTTMLDVFVIETGSGQATALDSKDSPYDAEFLTRSGDSDRVVVASVEDIDVFDLRTGEAESLEVGTPWPIAVTGDRIVSLDQDDRTLKVWDPDRADPLSVSDPIAEGTPLDQVLLAAAPGLAVAATGATATGASDQPMTLIVWRWEQGPALGLHPGSAMKLLHDLRIDDEVRFATVAADKTARQFDLRDGTWRPALPQNSDWVLSAVSARKGKRIYTAGADGRIFYWSTQMPAWSTAGAHPMYELLGHAGGVRHLVGVGPESRTLISTGSDRTARVWRLPETRRYEKHQDWVIGLDASSGEPCSTPQTDVGDTCLVTVSSELATLHRLHVDEETGEVDFADLGVLKPQDGNHLAQVLLRTGPGLLQGVVLYERSDTPELWDWDPDDLSRPAEFVRTLEKAPAPLVSLSITSDGSALFGGDDYGNLYMWDVDTGTVERYSVARLGATADFTVDPTGAWAAFTAGDGVQLLDWDAETTSDPIDLSCPDDAPDCTRGALYSVFSGDGSRLAVSTRRGDLHVWSTEGEHLAGPLALPGLSTSRPALSRDGRLLAAGTGDGLIQVWDVDTQKVIFQVRRHADSVNAVLFATRPGGTASTDGEAAESLLVSVSDDTTAAVIPCAPCADAAAAVTEAHEWVSAHPAEGSPGLPAD